MTASFLMRLFDRSPLLATDVFEYAYLLDYGFKRADYAEAFFKAIDWMIVGKRFGQS